MLTLRRAPSLVVEAPAARRVSSRPPSPTAAGCCACSARRAPARRPRPSRPSSAASSRARRRPTSACILTSSRVWPPVSLRERVTARLGAHLDRAARPHPPGLRVRHPAPGGGPARGPDPTAAQRARAGRHPARAAGRARRGEGTGPGWPERVHVALGTRGFRGELRDLLMRAVEHDLEPDDLARLGREHDRPEWVAAAEVLAEYDEVTALSAPGAYDPAWILGAAADLLEEDPDALERLRDGLRLVVVDDAQELTVCSGTAAAHGGRRARHSTWSCSATPTAPCRPSAAPTRATSPAGGPRLGEGPTLVLPTAYRLPQAVRRRGGAGSRPRSARSAAASSASAAAGRAGRQRRRAAAARGEPGGQLRRGRAARGAPARGHAVVGDGRHRARAGPHRHAAPRADVGRGPRRRARRPTCRCATRWPCARCSRCCEVVLDLARGETEGVDAQVAVDTLLSPIGGADAVGLRRLRRALRRDELAEGAGAPATSCSPRPSCTPAASSTSAPEAAPARRVARTIAAGVEAAEVRRDGTMVAGRPGSAPSRCCGRCGRPPGSARSGRRPRSAGGPARSAPTATSTPWSGCSTRRPSSSTGCPRPAPRSSSPTSRSQDIPGDTLVARSPVGESRSPSRRRRPPPGGSGSSSSSRACRRGSGPTCGCGGRCWARSTSSTSCRVGPTTFRAAQAAVRYDETRLVPGRPDPGERAGHRDGGAQRRRAAVGLPRRRRPGNRLPRKGIGAASPRCARTMTLPDPRRRAAPPAGLGRHAVRAHGGGRAGPAHPRGRARAPTRPSGGCCARCPTTVRCAPTTRRCGSRRARSSRSASAGCGGCSAPCGGDGPSVGAADIGTLVHDIAAELGDVDADDPASPRWTPAGDGSVCRPAGSPTASASRRTRMVRRLATLLRRGAQRAAGCGSGPSST